MSLVSEEWTAERVFMGETCVAVRSDKGRRVLGVQSEATAQSGGQLPTLCPSDLSAATRSLMASIISHTELMSRFAQAHLTFWIPAAVKECQIETRISVSQLAD